MARPVFVIGTARAALGEGGAAAACLRDALALSPALIDGHDNLGVVLGDLGDLPGARQALKRAAVLAPGRAQSYFNLGRVAQTADALHQASYRRALTLAPSYLEAWYNRGIAQRAARLVNAAPAAAAMRDFKRCAVLNRAIAPPITTSRSPCRTRPRCRRRSGNFAAP